MGGKRCEQVELFERDYVADIGAAIEILAGHYNRGEWRDVARVAEGIRQAANATERRERDRERETEPTQLTRRFNTMLVLTRKDGERVRIGENIVVHVKRCRRGQVSLGFEAPRDVRIL